MPRKPNRRVDSAEVQGPGSYVTFGQILWGAAQDLQRRRDADEIGPTEHQNLYVGLHVADWNWTDAEGTPLPLPSTDPDVLRRLTQDEAVWLITQYDREAEAEAAASKSG